MSCNSFIMSLKIITQQFVGNKAKGRITKRVFQENKARQFLLKTNISYPLIRTRTFFVFRKIWHALFPWNTRVEIRLLAWIRLDHSAVLLSFHNKIKITKIKQNYLTKVLPPLSNFCYLCVFFFCFNKCLLILIKKFY